MTVSIEVSEERGLFGDCLNELEIVRGGFDMTVTTQDITSNQSNGSTAVLNELGGRPCNAKTAVAKASISHHYGQALFYDLKTQNGFYVAFQRIKGT